MYCNFHKNSNTSVLSIDNSKKCIEHYFSLFKEFLKDYFVLKSYENLLH